MARRELYEDEQKAYDDFIFNVNHYNYDDDTQELIDMVDNLIDIIINNEHREVVKWARE